MIKYNPSGSCNMNNKTEINYVVKACNVKLISIRGNFENMLLNTPTYPFN